MSNDLAAAASTDRSLAFPLLFGVAAGPTAWMARLLVGLPLVPWACETGLVVVLHLVSWGFAAVAAAALAISVRTYRRVRTGRTSAELPARTHFVTVLALALSGASLFAIVLESLAIFWMDPCVR